MRLRSLPFPAWLLAGGAALPLLVWWLGWHPGFASSDSIDQLGQVASGRYFNAHPPIHTLYLALLSLGGSAPGLVGLFQLLALTGLLVYGAKWLIESGVPVPLTIGAAWLLGLSPAVAPTTLAFWKDVPFALAMLWVWIELLALATDQERAGRAWPAVRIGLALSAVWLLRGNGPITVLLVLLVLAWAHRRRLRLPASAASVAAGVVLLVAGPLYSLLQVEGSGIDPVQVFLPDVAASYVAEPETFTPDEVELLERVAPLSIWTGRYDCHDSTPLLFDPRFDRAVVSRSSPQFLALQIDILLRDPDSVLAHRLCTAGFLYLPPQPEGAYFHRPPYDIPDNDLGLAREPISTSAWRVTDRIWRWAEVEERLWLTWRPAVVILPALGAVVLFAFRSPRLLLPSSLFLAHLLNVTATSPAQEFRYAYPLYLMGVLTVTLIWPSLARGGPGERPTLAGSDA